ncbi:MAG: hypothetical protein LBQ40_06905 [Clostridiales bacterium]|nr:hypothetical protein [Clostridiales bacterium]
MPDSKKTVADSPTTKIQTQTLKTNGQKAATGGKKNAAGSVRAERADKDGQIPRQTKNGGGKGEKENQTSVSPEFSGGIRRSDRPTAKPVKR